MKTYLAGILAGALALSATGAFAQDESTNRVNAETDWSVFVEDDPTQCWVVSTPSETVNTRDGRVVSVRRGEILMFVSFWPGQERLGEVSFTGGYPFADGSTVTMSIGSTSFELFTDGEMAWAASPQDDDRIITAMKRGAEAVLTARSSRGTQTQDTFSLLGFTAAVEDAETRCGN
ncbi:invasion associated locus B family protein [Gymnodinialimonas sp. 57CJ19]|uniref:invasion associated locus B family protein n=1 Tax=Gymnodinialimonas sp. 57CJ19 TaxID=3138498 RepID=UPI0021FDE620|nr:invasion associated locus B family protein [Rhodobacteraceae bacterium M385]